MKISLCMIVKNEEENIINCLDCAMKVVDEAIVVDTGSTDKTVELLNQYSNENTCVKIIHHKWENNFSKARNLSMQYASGDWIIVLDADERLFADRIKLEKLINCTDDQAFIIPIYNLMNNDNIEVTSVMIRVFKNNKPHYSGAIHEQLYINDKKYIGEVLDGNICKIYHYGYYKQVYNKKDKEKRNMEIIKKQINKEPNNPFHWYNKGVMEMISGNFNTAIDDFLKCNELTNKKRYSFHDNLILELIKCMMALENYNQIINLVSEVSKDIYISKIPDIYYYCGIAYAKIEKYGMAIEYFNKAIKIGEYEKGVSRYGTGSFLSKIQWSKVLLLQNKKSESIGKMKEAVLDNRNIHNVGIEELIGLLKEEKRDYEIEQLEQIINNKNINDPYLSSEFFRNKDHVKNNITTLVEDGKLEAAKELILDYEKIVNDDIDVYSIKGVIAMMEGKMEDAERVLKKGLSKDENYLDLLYNLAYLYQYNKQNELAITYYKKSLHSTNDKTCIDRINNMLNKLLEDDCMYNTDNIRTPNSFVEIDNYKNELKKNIENLVGQGLLKEAKDILIQYEKIIKDDGDIYSIKGVIAMMENDMKKAERIFKEGINRKPLHFDLLYNLGFLYEMSEKYLLAYEQYRKIVLYVDTKTEFQIINKIRELEQINEIKEYIIKKQHDEEFKAEQLIMKMKTKMEQIQLLI